MTSSRLRGYDWIEVDRDLDLFGDGTLRMLIMPGHTPGECCLVVNLPNRSIILASDTVQMNEAIELVAPMPLDYNASPTVLSIPRLRAIRDATDARVWPSHDPICWAEYPHGPAPVE